MIISHIPQMDLTKQGKQNYEEAERLAKKAGVAVLLQSIHCLNSRVSLCFVNPRQSSYYYILKYWRTLHVKEYERRYKIGLKRFYFKLKVYVG